MSDAIPTLVKSIFQKESLHDCSLEELQNAASQYSYFTPAQFLLAEKLRAADENLYAEQLQKLSLHFSNPLWLDYLLNAYKAEMFPGVISEKGLGDETTTVEEKHQNIETTGEINLKSEREITVQAEEMVNEPQNENENFSVESIIGEEEPGNIESSNEEVIVKSELEIPVQVEETVNDLQNENVDFSGETTVGEEKSRNIETSNEEINIKSELEIPVQVEEVVNEPQNENVDFSGETTVGEEKSRNIETSNEEINIKSELEIPVQVEEVVNEPQNENVNFSGETTIGEETRENMKSGSDIHELGDVEGKGMQISIPPLPDLKQEPAEPELSFEPYHTVDYFASQGIKFIPEEKPVDRFGRQLKSFTEWLKTMKRLPQMEMAKISDSSPDEKVQELADHSISEDEIVTETMAEVWLKQGNKEKAIETYNKLSLHNPGKSAYFASLIEQLKDS